ncbi:MAG: cyclase [Acidimicrobiia bacterium]|nr:SRPBCC family protein [bacterium]MXZ30412.1 cyclase [Acidimicrobiia bacterium]MYB23777.1 cyclase [Acidimicrobiia bacterium]MYE67930.1 cyclase [Acidimicrobiia bacterium]MYJ13677.1 cyclase [Acidimicrobiia bacterium]
MVDFSTRQTLVNASPMDCFEVVVDFEQYPQWAPDVKEARVLRRDDSGAGGLVAFRAAAMGRSVSYTLKYFYGTNPLRVAWRLTEGDQVRQLDGEYEMAPAGEDGAKTLITYSLAAELTVAVPGFVKRRAESRIMLTALDQLRRRIEALAAERARPAG